MSHASHPSITPATSSFERPSASSWLQIPTRSSDPQTRRRPAVATYNGHIHEKWREHGPMLNVWVDANDFRPVTEDQVRQFVAGLS